MSKFIVDCTNIKSEEEFWDKYLSSVDTVEGDLFGRNLDALWDALHAGGPGAPIEGTKLISVRNSDSLKSFREGLFYDHLKQISYDLRSDPGSLLSFRVL
ncbi:barstar family protein [Microbulbifer sp. THAF38]|uniref:barstar family protein n=1 Tax=Microbulbifer sp. THAF38 TaxID=2587856 RepID=UPI001562A47C|nr:barstar family protein [Microbulbifer sp. THAF38]